MSDSNLIPLIDSHAHLDSPDFDKDRDSVIQRAFEENIEAILCPAEATDPGRLDISLSMARKHKAISAAAGVHPHLAKDFDIEAEGRIRSLAESNYIAAVGEIGLDFFYNFSSSGEQIEIFRRQLSLAEQYKLPVIIHSRNAGQHIIAAVKAERFSYGGVLHCFTEDWILAKAMLDMGFSISFSGILTFPKAAGLRETAKKIPLNRLLVETDSPYLTPVPYRGKIKRNEPRLVRETAGILAGIKKITLEKLARATSDNYRACFQFEINQTRC